MDSVVAFFVRLLELLFVIGCVGSLIVILLAGVEDVETIFSASDEEKTVASAPPAKQ